ncbi:MAG: hypothetical protein K8S18_16015, partial [Desulfobacula sp.]|nr:hypothetical protein [Desulfobacula sp.]
MNYPDFDTNLLLTVEKPFQKLYVDELLTKKIVDTGLSFDVQEIERERNYSSGEWISSSSFINLYINDSFIEYHFNKSTPDLAFFLDNFMELIKPIIQISGFNNDSDILKRTRPIAIFSTFYRTKDEYIFHYLFEIDGNENDYIIALQDVFKTINLYNDSNKNEFQNAIKESYVQSNRIKYLLYSESMWVVLNPLLEAVREINERYRENNDFRIKKPYVMMHRDDYRKQFVLDSNWVLVINDLETLMIQPNDVSLYSNISDTNLKTAQEFYHNTILPRFAHYHGSFPPIETQKEYYDYFELIITAIIFAYTSLEALANICIPNNFEYLIEKGGIKTIYSKEAIERKFSLREKFKKVLKSILNTPDPTKEKWWNQYIELENLRDEIVHTKQSKSEDRYSQ